MEGTRHSGVVRRRQEGFSDYDKHARGPCGKTEEARVQSGDGMVGWRSSTIFEAGGGRIGRHDSEGTVE